MNLYLSSEKTKVFKNLDALNQGALSFDEASFTLFKDFPNATLTLRHVQVSDSSLSGTDQAELIAEELSLAASLADWSKDEIQIQQIKLQKAVLKGHKTKSGYSDLGHLFKAELPADEGAKRLFFNETEILINDLQFSIEGEKKGSQLSGHAHHLKTIMNEGKGMLDMHLDIDQLMFNQERGAYLSNSVIKARLAYDLEDGKLLIHPSEMKLAGEKLKISAALNFSPGGTSTLVLENPKTHFGRVMPLLTESLQESLAAYDIDGEIYSRIELTSSFAEGEDPLVKVYVNAEGNDMVIKDILFMDTKLDGYFVNRIEQDIPSAPEGSQNMRFVIEDLETTHQNFFIKSDQGLITSGPDRGDQLNIKTDISGSSSSMSEWLDNKQFIFHGGDFLLDAHVRGPLDDLSALIEQSDATLSLNQVNVDYSKAQVSFPFEHMTLTKNGDQSHFDVYSSASKQTAPFRLVGDISHIADVLLGSTKGQVNSDVTFESERLNWSAFLDLFNHTQSGANLDEKVSQQKKSLKSTLEGVYEYFKPRIHVDIDVVEYKETIRLNNFTSGFHFDKRDSLVLENTKFRVGDGQVELDGDFDIANPFNSLFGIEVSARNVNLSAMLPELNYLGIPLLKTIEGHAENLNIDMTVQGKFHDIDGLIPNSSQGQISFWSKVDETVKGKILFRPDDMRPQQDMAPLVKSNRIEIEGDPVVFNEFFDNKEFFFKNGVFSADFDFGSGIKSFEQLLNEAFIDFELHDGTVYYRTGDVDLPLSSVRMKMREDKADVDLLIKSDSLQRELSIKGNAINLSELIVGNTPKEFSSNIQLYSPYFEWNLFTDLLGGTAQESDAKTNSLLTEQVTYHSMKRSLRGMMQLFDPLIELQVDSFIYSPKLSFANVNAQVDMPEENVLRLQDTGFDIYDGSMSLQGEFDLSLFEEVPFSFQLTSTDLDAGRLLESLDFLSIDPLKEAEKLEGRLTMNLGLSSIIAPSGKELVNSVTQGELKFEIVDLELEGLSYVDSLAIKLNREERFKTLMFAPISNTITIDGEHLNIPLMEIQSNALNMFMQGDVGLGPDMDLWITLPLDNIRKNNSPVPMQLRGYAALGGKVHLQITQDETGQYKYTFRSSKRKYYKNRGILKQLRVDRKKFKSARKKIQVSGG